MQRLFRAITLTTLALALAGAASAQSFLPIGRSQPPAGRAAPPSAPSVSPAEQMNMKLDLPWTNFHPDSRMIARRMATALQGNAELTLKLDGQRRERLAALPPAQSLETAPQPETEPQPEPYRLKPARGNITRGSKARDAAEAQQAEAEAAVAETTSETAASDPALLPEAGGNEDLLPETLEAAPELPAAEPEAEPEPGLELSAELSSEPDPLAAAPLRLRGSDLRLEDTEDAPQSSGLLSAETSLAPADEQRSAALKPSAGLLEMGTARLAIKPLSSAGSRSAQAPQGLALKLGSPDMPDYPVPSKLGEFSRGSSKKKLVALTFDDGPNPEFSWKLLSILEHYEAKATFFMVGVQAKRHPEWVKMAHGAGHEIASQTYDHFRLPNLPRSEKVHQIDAYQQIIEELTGQTPRFLRPPGGQVDKETAALAKERGMVIGLWDVALNDTKPGREADDMLKYALKEVRPGSVVLAHDGIPATLEMLPELIEALREKGYEFVTMSELAAAK